MRLTLIKIQNSMNFAWIYAKFSFSMIFPRLDFMFSFSFWWIIPFMFNEFWNGFPPVLNFLFHFSSFKIRIQSNFQIQTMKDIKIHEKWTSANINYFITEHLPQTILWISVLFNLVWNSLNAFSAVAIFRRQINHLKTVPALEEIVMAVDP